MRKINLYTGGGVSLSPVDADGRTLSTYVRLVAEENHAITDGKQVLACVDVLETEAENWVEIPEIEPEHEVI